MSRKTGRKEQKKQDPGPQTSGPSQTDGDVSGDDPVVDLPDALTDTSDLVSDDDASPDEFRMISKIVGYLQSTGYDVKPSTVYHHVKVGILKPDRPKATYSRDLVDKYGADNLRRENDTVRKRRGDKSTDLYSQKQLAEIRRIDASRKKAEYELEILKRTYISRSEHEEELIAQSHGFVNYLSRIKHTLPSKLVIAAHGDATRISAVYAVLSDAIDEILLSYSREDHHEVDLPGVPS